MLGGSSPEPTSCTRMTQPVASVPEQKPRPVCMELTKGSERGGRRPWPPRPSEYSSSPAHCCHLRPLALDSGSHRAFAASRLHRPSFSSSWPFPMGHKKIGCFYWEEEGDPRLQHAAHGRTCVKPVLSVMAWAHNTVVWSPLASGRLLPNHVSEDTTFGFTLAHIVEMFS